MSLFPAPWTDQTLRAGRREGGRSPSTLLVCLGLPGSPSWLAAPDSFLEQRVNGGRDPRCHWLLRSARDRCLQPHPRPPRRGEGCGRGLAVFSADSTEARHPRGRGDKASRRLPSPPNPHQKVNKGSLVFFPFGHSKMIMLVSSIPC